MATLNPQDLKQIFDRYEQLMQGSEDQNDTEEYARQAAENIKFILQKDRLDILECATHKINNYRGIIGSIVSEDNILPSNPNITTGEQLLIHICYSLLRELKDVVVWDAFHQQDAEFRDWVLREVFDVEIHIQETSIEAEEQAEEMVDEEADDDDQYQAEL